MKKLVMKLLVSALAVFVVFGTKAAITNAYDAPTAQDGGYEGVTYHATPSACIVYEENADNIIDVDTTLWNAFNDNIVPLPNKCKPGSVLKAGDELSFDSSINNDFDDAVFLYYNEDSFSGYTAECDDGGMVHDSAFVGNMGSSFSGHAYERIESNSVTIGTAEGCSSWWKVGYVVWGHSYSENYLFVILLPYEEPDEVTPVNVECTLVKSGNTTRWLSPEGKVVWTITEEADKITADLTDWAAVNADGVKAWAESGKALSITYKYNGYTVTINVPAGELTDTGAEWYGPEYLAAVNQKYVVVKDSTGLVVPNDRIYKK